MTHDQKGSSESFSSDGDSRRETAGNISDVAALDFGPWAGCFACALLMYPVCNLHSNSTRIRKSSEQYECACRCVWELRERLNVCGSACTRNIHLLSIHIYQST